MPLFLSWHDLVFRQFVHLAREAVTSSRNILDQITMAEIFKSLSQKIDVVCKVSFLDERIVPNVLPDLFLGYDRSAAFDQNAQELDRL